LLVYNNRMSKICIAYGFYIKNKYLYDNQAKIIDSVNSIRKNIVLCDKSTFNIKKFCNENHFESPNEDLNISQTYYSLDNLDEDDINPSSSEDYLNIYTNVNPDIDSENTCKYTKLKYLIRNELEKIENNDLDIEYSNNHYYIFIKKTFRSTNLTSPLLINKSFDSSKNLSTLSRSINIKDSNIDYVIFVL